MAEQNKHQAHQLLVFSFLFPPILEPRAIQVGRLVRHLSLPTTTVCASTDHLMNDNAMNLSSEGDYGTVHRIPFRTNRLQRILWNYAARCNLPLLFRTPDRFTAWTKPAAKTAKGILSQAGSSFWFMASFAQPWSSHLAALLVARQFDFPWLVYMSDPWSTPLFGKIDRLTKAYNLALEKQVFERATFILFHSEELARLVLAGHGGRFDHKIRILPQGYDLSEYPAQCAKSPDRTILRYLGSFYGARNPIPLLQALNQIKRDDPQLLDQVAVEIVGDYDPVYLQDPAYTNLPPGLVVFRPMVPYRESLRLMKEADGLLLVDAPAVNCVFPAKLADYLGAGTPVLGITPEGPARRIILEQGGLAADPADPAEIAQMLTEFLSSYKKGCGAGDRQTQYDIRAIARHFEQLLDDAGREHAKTA